MPALRESEKREDDLYEKLPFFQIEEKYGKTEAGKSLGFNLSTYTTLCFLGMWIHTYIHIYKYTDPAHLRAFVARVKASLFPSGFA